MELQLPQTHSFRVKKSTLANGFFLLIILLIASPWIVERKFLLNEFIAVCGMGVLLYKRFKIGNEFVSAYVLALLAWCGVHVVISLFRMDAVYYYLRNLVIVYSIFAYFLGYYLFPYLDTFLASFLRYLGLYILVFLVWPVSRFLFERFGMATLFPSLFRYCRNRLIFPLLLLMNITYSITYDSATIIILTAFYLLLWISPGYRFFKQVSLVILLGFTIFFIAFQSNLNLIAPRFSPYNDDGIIDVRNSHPLMAVDPNSTWRLILWKEVIVDHFPANLFGIGFGTPMFKYYPVEDYSKLESLPYVLGAHNSFVYLFGRLGLVYIILSLFLYKEIFKEYFRFKTYHYRHKTILIFWSFVAITATALFNPVLESPIFSGVYWVILGLLGKAIYQRKRLENEASPEEINEFL